MWFMYHDELILQYFVFCWQPIAIAKIRKDFMTDPMFNVECIKKKSLAAGTLCAWVMAIEAYDRNVKGSGGTVEKSK